MIFKFNTQGNKKVSSICKNRNAILNKCIITTIIIILLFFYFATANKNLFLDVDAMFK